MRDLKTFCSGLGMAGLAALALSACTFEAPLPYYRPNPDAVAQPGLYAIPDGATPDGTFRATIARGASVARGTLSTNTLTYPITLQGLSAPYARGSVVVTGQVFGLGTTQQLLGLYKPVEMGGQGGVQLGNDNLVAIRIAPAVAGEPLAVAPDGVALSLQR
jgi:hypothetical protein